MSHNRRIGNRFPVGQFTVGWAPPVTRRLLARRRLETASIVDLSVTGALLRAKSNPQIMRGTQVDIRTGAGTGTVGVRRIEPDNHEHSLYGVSFIALDEPLRDLIYETLAADRPADLEWRWRHTR